MKLTSLICVAAACSNLAPAADDGLLNYSLWPRRPEEIAEARAMLLQQQLEETLKLLAPLLRERSIGGQEARSITAAINIRRYLSRENPHANLYTVRSGDLFARIAQATDTPIGLLFLLNGTINPGQLKIGQKLVIAPMNLQLDIDLMEREIRLWDAENIVACYPLHHIKDAGKDNEESQVEKTQAFFNAQSLTTLAPGYTSANKVLSLTNGAQLFGSESTATSAQNYQMSQKDINQLALLLRKGTKVRVLRHATEQ